MPFATLAERLRRGIPLGAGLLVALLGLSVLIGWQVRSTFWTQVRPWLTPMPQVTALAFMLCGSGLVALHSRRRGPSIAISIAVLAIAATALVQLLADIDVQIAPNTSIAFMLAAAGMLAVRRYPVAGAVLGVGVTTLGVVALLGYAIDVTQAFGWGDFTRMAIHSSLGLTIFGAGLITFAFAREKAQTEGQSWWRPILAGAAAAIAGILFWEALHAQERDLIHRTVDATARGVQREMVTTSSSVVIALTRLAEHGMDVRWDSPEDWQQDARLTVGAFRGFEQIEWIDAEFEPRIVASPRDPPRQLVESDRNLELRAEALERSRTSGEPVIVGPFEFEDGGTAFRIVIPLAPQDHPEAYLSGVFSAEQTLSTLSHHLSYGYSVVVLCRGQEVFRVGDLDLDASDAVLRRLPIDLPGPVPWEIAISPTPELLAVLATPLPEVALGSSLLISLLLMLTVRFGDVASMRARDLERAVKERTLELEESMKNLQSEVAERRRTEATLRRMQILGSLVSAELDLDKVVQAVTDAGTELTGAQFGCLRYSVTDDRRSIARHAISGRPREAATSLGELPEFPGGRVIRLDNAWKSALTSATTPRLPVEVVSYLAVPVNSRSGNSWGALAFGHSAEAVFTERDEEIAVSLAAQAAIAMDNASLYEAELRASAQAKATSQAKDNFIHLLGHELRNPVGSIRTALQVLSEEEGDPEAEDAPGMRAIINRQVGQLARLADDLLEVSQLTSEKLTLRPEPFDLGVLVRESVDTVRARFETAGLSLAVSTPEEPVVVHADPYRMQQVLANLLANARKFTDSGGQVRVELSRSEPGRAEVNVTDTGGGIDPADLARVFEPFVQTALARDRMTGGLGLGLPIVKGLVEAQGGEVEVRSPGLGGGSRFTFRLPVHAEAAPPLAPTAPLEDPLPRRILVIDDHFDSADALKRLLNLSGNQVEVAYDGPQGIEQALRFNPDVLICDIGLPGMDGFEVARRLGEDPRTESIRLVALTGFGDEDTVRAAREAGFAHHLTKPVETETLRKILAEV